MRIFAIDDEQLMLGALHKAIAEAEPGSEINDFKNARSVLDAIDQGVIPDVVFSDIRLPRMNGLNLAVKIKEKVPNARIVFVTGYMEYAAEVWRMHINEYISGYLMKPVTAAAIREELDHLPEAPQTDPGKLQVRCFGQFEVFWQGEPLKFGRQQTKELPAFLIDKEGAACTAEEVSAALWEDETNMHATKGRIRNIISDLKSTLSSIGMDDALIRYNNQAAIRRDMVDCDYYRMLDGDMNAVNSFRGEYMAQYSWAELTEGKLLFRKI